VPLVTQQKDAKKGDEAALSYRLRAPGAKKDPAVWEAARPSGMGGLWWDRAAPLAAIDEIRS
jgi:hypothetical protein